MKTAVQIISFIICLLFIGSVVDNDLLKKSLSFLHSSYALAILSIIIMIDIARSVYYTLQYFFKWYTVGTIESANRFFSQNDESISPIPEYNLRISYETKTGNIERLYAYNSLYNTPKKGDHIILIKEPFKKEYTIITKIEIWIGIGMLFVYIYALFIMYTYLLNTYNGLF
jgi:hypothetical protein